MKERAFHKRWSDIANEVISPQSYTNHKGGENHSLVWSTVSVKREKMKKYINLKSKNYQVQLTPRESQTLLLIAYGNTVPESAKVMGLSSRTVELYVVKLRYKFQCSSKRELIERVVAEGLVLQLREKLGEDFFS